MRTITVEISEQDFKRFADGSGKINFKTLRKRVLADALRTSIDSAVRAARKNGLSEMTVAEIDAEVRAVRNQHA